MTGTIDSKKKITLGILRADMTIVGSTVRGVTVAKSIVS